MGILLKYLMLQAFMYIQHWYGHVSGCSEILYDHFFLIGLLLFLQDIVDTHPGLIFLGSAPEFHERYVETVSL